MTLLAKVCGDAAAYVDPKDPNHIAETMSSVSRSPERQEELRLKGFQNVGRFSWSKFAQTTWNLYLELAPEMN